MANLNSITNFNNTFYRTPEGFHQQNCPFDQKFMTFTWRGLNSWKNFGCFIINNKDDLHWGGRESKASYITPLFGGDYHTISNVSFDQRAITLKIGLYGITEEDYDRFYMWLDPLVISRLHFDYEPKYYYKAKVTSLKESTKYVLGSETKNSISKDLFYVETSITFQIQGENCGWGEDIVWNYQDVGRWEHPLVENSRLRNGIKVKIGRLDVSQLSSLQIIATVRSNTEDVIRSFFADPPVLDEENIFNDQKKLLCQINFLPINEEGSDNINIQNFEYDSYDGLVTYGENKTILSLTQSKDFVAALNTSKFLLPGTIQDSKFYDNNKVEIQIIIKPKNSQLNFVLIKSDSGSAVNFCNKNESNTKIVENIMVVSRNKKPLI